jgi:hypothetical protein
MFRQMEKELGFPLDGLDRLRMWIRLHGDQKTPQRLTVMEGRVGLPPSVNGDHWTDETIGEHKAKISVHGNSLFARVGTDLLVQGERELIEPVLLGKAKGGRPGADQMSLLSGRQTDLLHIYVDLLAARGSRGEFGFLDDIEYPDDDPATHLLLRISTQRDGDDERLLLEGIVRHRKGEKGLELTEAGAKKWLTEMQAHPRFAALKKIWSAVVFSKKGPDLTAQLDLGRPRAAVGTLAQLISPIFAGRVAVAREEAEAVRAVDEARRAAEEAERRAKEEQQKAEEQKKKESGGK